MYLKSLELHGFKSFPNRTVLNFEKGATVVVGPNGSGKSNISDAMRWVLGEISSRNIRGTKMEDVIFGGTDDRRPMGFAEVSVTFDNTDEEHKIDSPYDEITVTRRYYRAGDSEYYINKKPVRLKDIHELFLNTGIGREGYSIIGQGKVAEMISKKSEDRRNIFEEAAGISKYRYKKQEAERKLETTNDNLIRINDIWLELDSRIVPLAKQAEKAKKYKGLIETKRQADVSLWLFDTKKLHDDITETDSKHKISINEYELARETLDTLEKQNDRLDNSINDNNVQTTAYYEKIKDLQLKLSDLDAEYKLAINNREHIASNVGECRANLIKYQEDIKNAQQRRKEQIGYLDAKKAEYSKLQKEKASLEESEHLISAQISDSEKVLDESLNRLTKVQQKGTDLRVRIDVLKNSKDGDKTKIDSILSEIDSYSRKNKELEDEVIRCDNVTKSYSDKITELDSKSAEYKANIEKLEEEAETKDELSDDYRRKADDAKLKITTIRQMEEQLEGYSESVRYVMNNYNNGKFAVSGKIYGPVSQLISMDFEYSVAIETALGANIQHIIVEDDKTARDAIAILKKSNAGRATFYPVNTIVPQGETEEIKKCATYKGYVGRADKLVKCDNKFRSIVEWLLLRTVVFDNLENASFAAKALDHKVKMVTLDGQIIHAGGSYTGGSTKVDGHLFGRAKQIEDLTKIAKDYEQKSSDLKEQIVEIDKEIEEASNQIKDLTQEKQLIDTLSRAQFAALDNAKAKLEANESLLAKLKSDYDNIVTSGEKADNDIEILSLAYKDIDEEIASIRTMRQSVEEERAKLNSERDDNVENSQKISLNLVEIRKDSEAIAYVISTIDQEINETNSKLLQMKEKISDFEVGSDKFEANQNKNRSEYNRVNEEINTATNKIKEITSTNDEYATRKRELRDQISSARENQDSIYRNMTNYETKLVRLRDDDEKLSQRLVEEYNLNYAEALALNYPEVTKENRAEVASTQASVRASIRAIGDINPAAEEEYAELKVRYDEMSLQRDDLRKAYDDLSDIVSKIEDEMKTRFITAFTEINKNFGVTFSELFGGGTGELSLIDPDDILNSGIEIKAAPPGKIIKSLSLLSGGEQAFVAIALFFAILKVNPTPFCILDEIEAALDEVNVYRFGEYIKKFASETQFVLITHRRGTMEVGDRLYGVTMPERGVSRVIPINADEIESKKKELLDGVL